MLYICSATALGFPFLQPYLKVGNETEYRVNFAVAGATALDTSFLTEKTIFTQTDLSLDVQIGWFQDLKRTKSCIADHFSRALYVMGEIGTNDYLDSTFTLKPLNETESLVPLVISKIHNALQVIKSPYICLNISFVSFILYKFYYAICFQRFYSIFNKLKS